MELNVVYKMEIYEDGQLMCDVSSEYPKKIRHMYEQSKFLDSGLDIKVTYKFFKEIYKDGVLTEEYEVTDSCLT